MKFKELREKYRSKFPSSLVAAAVKIAIDMGGNMTGAHKKIEAMKKGLSKDKLVQDALRQANESVSEAVDRIEFPDMDDDSHATASMIAKKHGLKIVSKKGKIGNNLTVSGNSQKMSKFLKALPSESVNEDKMSLSTNLMRVFKRDIEKLMKKHDAYVSDSNSKYTTISSPKPVDSGFKKDLFKLLGMNEEQSLTEGTWDIPDTKTKLQKLMDLVSKPFFGTTEKDVDKYLKLMPFGDDELYDDLGILYFIPGSQKSKKFPKTDLNQVAMDSLNGRWLTAKKKGNGWDITHINFDIDMDETIKRKSGNIRPGRRMKVEL